MKTKSILVFLVNKPSGKYPLENIAIKRESQRVTIYVCGTDLSEIERKSQLSRLEELSSIYKSKRFVLSGIDKEAQENNRQVVEAILAVEEQFRDRVNDIFAVQMGGSRIKGYNAKDSDIDIVPVTPDTLNGNDDFIYQAIEKELRKRRVTNKLDPSIMGMWDRYEIKTDPDEFIYTVDHHGVELITLFGYTLYQNPNLLLSRLAALEIIKAYTYLGYNWSVVSEEYARTYLGEREFLVEKIAERLELPIQDVAKIFTQSLFNERYKKFELGNPLDMYRQLKNWYKQNQKQLGSYVMRDVYEGVKELLDSGR